MSTCPAKGIIVNGACYPPSNYYNTQSDWLLTPSNVPSTVGMATQCNENYIDIGGGAGLSLIICTKNNPSGLVDPYDFGLTVPYADGTCMSGWSLNSANNSCTINS